MAKKVEIVDPGTLDGPELARFLANRVDEINISVNKAIDGIKSAGRDLQNAIETDMQGIKPICEQFPNLCKKVEDLQLGLAEVKPSPTTTVSRAAENLALHYKECTDPDCRRSIESRLSAIGFKPPVKDPAPDAAAPAAETAIIQSDEGHDDKKEDAKPPVETAPWEKLKISESKYKHNKSYFDDVIKNGG